MTKWIFLKSDEAGINTGAEPNGGTDAAASTGRPRTGVGAAGVATAVAVGSEEAGTGIGTEAGSGTDAAVSTSGPRTGVGAADAVTAVSIGSEEAGTGTGAETGGGTDSAVSTGGARPGIDETCSRAAGAIAPVAFGSGEAGIGTGAGAGGGRDAATCGSRFDATAETRSGVEAVGAGTTSPALGLEEIEIVEMTRGTVFGDASRMSIGCSFSLEPALVTDVLSLLFWTILLGTVPALRIGGTAGKIYAPNMPR